MWADLRQLWPVGISYEDLIAKAGEQANLERSEVIDALQADAQAAYDRREAEFGPEVTRDLERQVVLAVLDRKWREHLYEMDYLREGIGLRAYSQRDPLVEYQREGYEMFSALMDSIEEETVGFLFNVEVQIGEPDGDVEHHWHADGTRHDGPMHEGGFATPPTAAEIQAAQAPEFHFHADGTRHDGPLHEGAFAEPPAQPVRAQAKGFSAEPKPKPLTYSGPSEDGQAQVKQAKAEDPYAGVGRNQPCPCGSGKKFKQCHGAPGAR